MILAAPGEVLLGGSLPRTMLTSGASCVLGSFWPVPDIVAAVVVPTFAEKWASGMSSARALYAAVDVLKALQLDQAKELIEDAPLDSALKTRLIADLALFSAEAPFADPFYWGSFAAFVVMP